jgi:hypothetical protein
VKQPRKIDFTKLLGFGSVADELAGRMTFKDSVIDARLGAKVGLETWVAGERRNGTDDGSGSDTNNAAIVDKVDYAKLLGFEALRDQVSGSVDFQEDTINAKLGAKVGVEAMA